MVNIRPQLIQCEPSADKPIWRFGRQPNPWNWTDWLYSGGARWDDSEHQFRTIYAGDTPFSCLVEFLSHFRADPAISEEIERIVENSGGTSSTQSTGVVAVADLSNRRMVSASLGGTYCDIRRSETISALHRTFRPLTTKLNLPDFDASVLKSTGRRTLTQRIATFIYERVADKGATIFDGIRYSSRHGDDLYLWAIFERPGDALRSRRIKPIASSPLDLSDPDVQDACGLLGIVLFSG